MKQFSTVNYKEPVPQLPLSDYELSKFSLMNLIRGLHAKKYDKIGFEMEVSTACEKFFGRSTSGAFVPFQVLSRGLTVGSATAGGNLKGTDHLANSFVDLLRARLVIQKLGAQVLPGLVGDVAIPKALTSCTPYWIAEGANIPTESAPTFGQVIMQPKTVTGYSDISRRLVLQSAPQVEQLIKNDLMQSIAAEIDRAAINGSGSSNEPLGILGTDGVGSVASDSGVVRWSQVVDLETEVTTHNVEESSCGYITHPYVKALMKKEKINATYGELSLWQKGELGAEGIVNGYPAFTTSLVPIDLDGSHSALIFGDFSQIFIGNWGPGIEINVDTCSLSLSGGLRLVAMMDCDVVLRHPEVFAVINDIDIA